MQVEQLEIVNFLAKHPPFDELPNDALKLLAQQTEIAYYRGGTDILVYGDSIQDLFVIRSGSVEIYRRTGELYNRLAEGDVFGQMGLMMNRRVRLPAKALEDTLVYCIPADQFSEYNDRFDTFADFFEAEGGELLRRTLSSQADNNDLTTVKIKSLLTREAVTVPQQTSVREAALTMTEEGVSSLLITDPEMTVNEDEYSGQLIGIVTDRDLRERVLAADISRDTPVGDVMTTDVAVIDDNAYVFEAMLAMLRGNVHHLPVMRRHHPIGVVAMSDIVRHESQSSLLLVRGIFAQQTVDDLKSYAQQLPSVFVRMVNEDANSHMIGSAMAWIGRSFKQRLLELAEEKLGSPPVPYCFLALGSMARDEQLIVTDQDNAIILDNGYDPAQHNSYFEPLANFVCDGLAACGYAYCSGEIMASNAQWRMTLSQWKEQFANWIENPVPEALLHSSIFFDLDGVWGKTSWAKQLQTFIARKARQNQKFLACLARNALNRTPPLGFFKGFVMEQDGQHKKSINLKRRGTAPLSDVIRVHALAVGSRAQNSFERLEDIIEASILPPGKGQDLSDALEYIAMVRIRHQAADIERGDEPDNNIEPEMLSTFERRNLKEAFQVLDKSQSFLKYRYHASKALR
ncbi:cyclic nucleotide-binding/CBS domain-containing protein [Endozoicomonas sp. SM1973]|uniref:Cyclic nucleotide-binding/CBS domain-containing protein n=1 Tax=Spartinivicinus marinus TaxID=2994442 RepID=A0A853I7A4_9GAMM|nr:DUF294 nucleotidyltransferase-like domain-containing protein [Spartinivicinus marinus]MCX4029511.1 DUF294 nucleotidyltransferase-like domain-containing protein [Spartinivicinus marinus]NYZ65085.1 cyclic nucleotide-binding/CBS domain-containing protein [Spartinivicinus marinus]